MTIIGSHQVDVSDRRRPPIRRAPRGKVHYGVDKPLCGAPSYDRPLTTDPAAVTCKNCLERLRAMQPQRRTHRPPVRRSWKRRPGTTNELVPIIIGGE